MTETVGPLSQFVERTVLNAPFWSSLAERHLSFQRCKACSNAWLPPREQCPKCLDENWTWERASGHGRLLSWVVYHRAVNQYVANRVPYNVAIVVLDEGPQLVANLIDDESASLKIDAPVELVIGEEGDLHVAKFRLV